MHWWRARAHGIVALRGGNQSMNLNDTEILSFSWSSRRISTLPPNINVKRLYVRCSTVVIYKYPDSCGKLFFSRLTTCAAVLLHTCGHFLLLHFIDVARWLLLSLLRSDRLSCQQAHQSSVIDVWLNNLQMVVGDSVVWINTNRNLTNNGSLCSDAGLQWQIIDDSVKWVFLVIQSFRG